MKLAFTVPYSTHHDILSENHENIGGLIKVPMQINGLQCAGVVVDRYDLPMVIDTPFHFFKSLYDSYKTLRDLISSSSYDIVFIRHLFPYITNYLALNRKHTCIIVFEVHDISRGFTLRKNYTVSENMKYLYLKVMDLILLKKLLLCSQGVVSVTSEISKHTRSITNGDLQYLSLGNGIDVSKSSLRHSPQYWEKTSLNILCVAQVAYWHGIDRFIRGMHDYSGDNTIILHIVGDGAELPNLKSLASELHLESQVIFHGFKSGADLDAMFDLCHIALGSLAGFRIGLNEFSSLKTKEYCARGIPFLMASKDVDISEEWEFTRMVPYDESPIDMNTVINFAEKVMADPNHPQKMRAFAEENLDWHAKMKTLKEFLETL